MDSMARYRNLKKRGPRCWLLNLLMLFALSSLAWDTALAQGQPEGQPQGEIVEWTLKWPEDLGEPFCLKFEDIQDLTRRAKEYPNLLEQNEKLKEENLKLQEQIADTSEKADLQDQRRQLAEERAAFYKEMADAYRQLSEKQDATISALERQQRANKITEILKTIGAVALFALGVFAAGGL